MDAFPIAGGGLCAGAAFLAWAVRGRSAAVFGKSVWRGSAGRRSVALTFDDGPSESTPAILDLLAQHRVPATFFQVGANVDRLPEVARAVAAAGHAIGNHSYAHPLFCFRSPAFIEADLRRAQQTIRANTGVEPEWFRAPYGVRWFGMGRAQRRLSLTGVMWSAIGRDWKVKFGGCIPAPGEWRLEWRYSVSTRRPRIAIAARHNGNGGSGAAPAAGAVGAGVPIRDVSQLLCPMS
jgi:peptidoglycan-N-acetylglucosamine deacetylase